MDYLIEKYVKNFFSNPSKRMAYLSILGIYNNMSDEIYLKKRFKLCVGYELNLDNPRTFNEKLQWLKIYDHNPKYTKMVDKYEVKKYVAEKIGEEYIIPTIGVWDNFNKIDFDALPEQFVLKCTHDSGGIVICKDRSEFNRKAAKRKLNKHLHKNYYWAHREWPYKHVLPRIIAEKYMEDESGYELKDYKFFVFNGKVKAMFIATDRNAATETCFDFFDVDFNHLPFTNGHPNSKHKIEKPENYEKMIELAEILGEKIPQVRIDFYNINGKIYFGEITFFHWSGLQPFNPKEWDYTFGSWIQLPHYLKGVK